MERPERTSGKLDVDRPSSARIYDYFLGGAHNFEVDRRAERMQADGVAKVLLVHCWTLPQGDPVPW